MFVSLSLSHTHLVTHYSAAFVLTWTQRVFLLNLTLGFLLLIEHLEHSVVKNHLCLSFTNTHLNS